MLKATEVGCAQCMGDRPGDLAKILVQFLTEKDERLNVSLGELRVLKGGSAEAAKAVPIRPVVDSGTHVPVSTNSCVGLQARLPSVDDTVIDSALVFSSHALAFNTATPVETGAARGSRITDGRPSIRINLAEDTTESVLDLHPLVLPNVLASFTVSSVAPPGMVTLKTKGASRSKSIHTRNKPSPVFDRVKQICRYR